jgi:WD40 repeat protein
VWNTVSGKSIRKYTQHADFVHSLDEIDDDRILSGSEDGVIHIWKISTGEILGKIHLNSLVYSVRVVSSELLACGLGGYVSDNLLIYNYTTGQLGATLRS